MISVPSYENAIIRGNTLKNNPVGVVLYQGAFLNVNVSSNTLTDNGGIYLQPFDQIYNGSGSFNVSRNIEIDNNVVTNTKGFVPAYINLNLQLIQHNTFWGYNMLGVEVRNNQITAVPGTVPFPFNEGYFNYVGYQNSAPYVDQGTSALVGTMFQNNTCINCPNAVTVDTGALDTVIWSTRISDTGGNNTNLVKDYNVNSSTTQKSIGTIVGP